MTEAIKGDVLTTEEMKMRGIERIETERGGGFSWALADYEIDVILDAFRIYIRSKPDIPAPADILAIIERQREYDSMAPADIETLRRYKAKGIPLSKAQEERLNASS